MDDYIPNTEITDDDKLWALLCYLPLISIIISIIMLLLEEKKSRPFIKYHAVQSLMFGVVVYVVSAILIIAVIGCITGLAAFGYSIYLGIKAYNGEYVEIPFVTDFGKKQGWIA